MADTENLELPRLVEGQASGEVTHNEAINRLDSLVMLSIIDRGLTTPPGGESNGDRYLVKATGTGAWAGHDDEIAMYYDGWLFSTPQEGWLMYIEDEDILVAYDGAAWGGLSINGVDVSSHATRHTNGDDDIQDATAGQKGLATAAQITKLDAIEAAADVTDEANVRAALAALTATADMNGQTITNVGTVDGRDVSTDGTKLDGVAASATANPEQAAEADLNQTITDPPTQAEVQAISDKVDAILAKLRSADIIST